MKLLLDECVPGGWGRCLQAHGQVATSWLSIGQAGETDDALISWARRHGYAIVTCDTDFGQRLWHSRAAGPTVIQLGAPTWLPQQHGEAVCAALAECEQRAPQQFFVAITATGHTYRLLALPLGQRQP